MNLAHITAEMLKRKAGKIFYYVDGEYMVSLSYSRIRNVYIGSIIKIDDKWNQCTKCNAINPSLTLVKKELTAYVKETRKKVGEL